MGPSPVMAWVIAATLFLLHLLALLPAGNVAAADGGDETPHQKQCRELAERLDKLVAVSPRTRDTRLKILELGCLPSEAVPEFMNALADTFANLLRLEKDTLDHCAEDFPKLRKVIDEFTSAKLEDIINAEKYAPSPQPSLRPPLRSALRRYAQ